MIPHNRILEGDCTQLLKSLPNNSVDLVITDPPYLVNYRDRDGRRILNDDNPANVLAAFSELYRVLKQDTLCVSFYGWGSAGAFLNAWTEAGFKPVDHLVWCKNYASSTGFFDRHHGQAYVLAKGRPPKPQSCLADVRPWRYSGNKCHPTEKAVSVTQPLIETLSNVGDVVLDPFAGSGSTCVAAALSGRRYIGMELEARYCELARKRLAGAERFQRGCA